MGLGQRVCGCNSNQRSALGRDFQIAHAQRAAFFSGQSSKQRVDDLGQLIGRQPVCDDHHHLRRSIADHHLIDQPERVVDRQSGEKSLVLCLRDLFGEIIIGQINIAAHPLKMRLAQFQVKRIQLWIARKAFLLAGKSPRIKFVEFALDRQV